MPNRHDRARGSSRRPATRSGRTVRGGRLPARKPAPRTSRTSSAPRARAPRASRRAGAGAYRNAAQQRLRRFRRGSIIAVALTALFLLLWGVPADAPGQQVQDTVAAGAEPAEPPPDPARSVEEATGTVRDLLVEFTTMLPGILVALALLAIAAIIVRVLRTVLRHALRQWERADAATAMVGVVVWLIAIGLALSVVAGDPRALVGSVGLLGLALSWALQAPIESFAGWLLNSFKGYYRVGDRIGVGEVFGDVYRIDVLNTTVWEAGGPDKPVQGAQPTGALITFPNSEVLRANVINYTRGFPFVWDEVVIGVSNDSDVRYAMTVISDVARRVIGPSMAGPITTYRSLLEKEGLAYDIADEPQVFVSVTESWTDITVRYLVDARQRRRWSSALYVEINAELQSVEHADRVRGSYPVTRVRLDDERSDEPTPT
jgi:small conductance mechanosensitive channel